MENLEASEYKSTNLHRAEKEFVIVVDTDFEVIIKDKSNGDIHKFRRVGLADNYNLTLFPKLPILKKGKSIFKMHLEIKKMELCLSAKKDKAEKGKMICTIEHNYLREPIHFEVVESDDANACVDKLTEIRNSLPDFFLADQFKVKVDFKTKNRGRSKLTKKWAA